MSDGECKTGRCGQSWNCQCVAAVPTTTEYVIAACAVAVMLACCAVAQWAGWSVG